MDLVEKIEKRIKAIRKADTKHFWREGQIAMIALYQIDSSIFYQIINMPQLNPFFSDEKLTEFWFFINQK